MTKKKNAPLLSWPGHSGQIKWERLSGGINSIVAIGLAIGIQRVDGLCGYLQVNKKAIDRAGSMAQLSYIIAVKNTPEIALFLRWGLLPLQHLTTAQLHDLPVQLGILFNNHPDTLIADFVFMLSVYFKDNRVFRFRLLMIGST